MGSFLPVTAFTAVIFCALIVQLAAKPQVTNRLTGIFMFIIGLMGMLFYGYGFGVTLTSIPLAVVRSLLAVCGMFMGKMDFSSVSAAPLFQTPTGQFVFWLVHLMALYAMSRTVITLVGSGMLRHLRLWLARRGDIYLIYGVNDGSLAIGKELIKQKGCSVVFVDAKPDSALSAAIAKAGCVLRSDDNAVKVTDRFLSGIGIGGCKRKITLYAIADDTADDLRYATALLDALNEKNIPSANTALVIKGQEENTANNLQVLGNKYGYGYVTVFTPPSVAARLLNQVMPPCSTISFDENCRAAEDFEALIIGFGKMGQAVLKSLVMNGQFAGSAFRADIFAPDCDAAGGFFEASHKALLKQYDIFFHAYDGRSRQLYEHISQRCDKIKYIAICTGSDRTSREIAEELTAYFQRQGIKVPVCQCSYSGIRLYDSDGLVTKTHRLYQPRLLNAQQLDHMAMILNHQYNKGSKNTALEDWMHCDYFSRTSCRASADFIPAMLRMAGKTAPQAANGDWQFTAQQLENLGITEHERWCAFHYCMGFDTMSTEEYSQRAETYRRQMAEDGKASIRIGKNTEMRTHACLIGWDELDELNKKEEAITGKKVDYKSMDIDNVLAIPQLLVAANGTEAQK